MQVRSAIVGRNGSVVCRHTSKWCLEQIWHIFFTKSLFGPDFTVQPSPVLWYKDSLHKIMSTKAGFFSFSLLSDVQKGVEHNTGVTVPNLARLYVICSNDPTYLVLKSAAKPESTLIAPGTAKTTL